MNNSLFSMVLCLAALLAGTPLAADSPGVPAVADKGVTLVTPTGTLYGSELVPPAKGKVPVVLLHAGSGPTDRDGNSAMLPGANNSLKYLAEGLAKAGIASVRFDKRGIAASQAAAPPEKDLRFENYVEDAAAWVKKLKADPRFSRVIIAGHSEGSLIGMLAAKEAGADGYVSIAGIARSADDVLRDQLKPKLPPELYAQTDATLKKLKAGETVADAPAALASLFRPSVQPYLISWFRYTPADSITGLKMPVLIAQGTADIQVGVSEAEALGKAQPGAKVLIVKGMNHVLKMVGEDSTLQKSSYSDPKLPVAPELLDAVTAFVKSIP